MEPRITLAELSDALAKTKQRWGSSAEARVRVRLSVVGGDAVELAEIEVRKDAHAGAEWKLLGYVTQVAAARAAVAGFADEQARAREEEGATTKNDLRALRELFKKGGAGPTTKG